MLEGAFLTHLHVCHQVYLYCVCIDDYVYRCHTQVDYQGASLNHMPLISTYFVEYIDG